MTSTDRPWIIYLRLSDFRGEVDGFDGREARLRGEIERFGGTPGRTVIENDLAPAANGKSRPASAFKRRKTPDGVWRVWRPKFHEVLGDIKAGHANLMCEDLDRAARDPRDLEDLVDACAARGGSARSLSGTLTLTNGGQGGEIDTARIMVTMANKASRDTARRVADGRKRLAGKSYQGGQRPYGYRPKPGTEKYHRKLIKVPEEAKVIEDAATGILDLGISLKAIARDLRERNVPTVTGTAWSAETFKDVLCKPAVAGLAVVTGDDGERLLADAPWDPILDRDTWERLTDKLNDPSRRTNLARANEPRWLLSGFATCGPCGGRTRVIGGKNRPPTYTGAECAHIRRSARAVDDFIATLVTDRLNLPDAVGLLRPPPRPDVDTGKLRAAARSLGRKRKAQIAMHREGILTDAELADSLRDFAARLAAIEVQLAASDQPDPLPEFRTGQPGEVVWAGLSLPRRRAVVQALIKSIVINRAARRGAGFDPGTLEVTWRPVS